jgi:peptidoglycan hydrolase-like protein with peptidoglycan-binding domain
MRQAVRRWLTGAGATAAVGAAILGGAGTSGAATNSAAGRAVPAHAAHTAKQAAPAYVPSGHVILYGQHGPAVRRMQRRLAELHYYPGKVDGQFGLSTLEAVWAFKEIQHLGTTRDPNDVGIAMQHRLVSPRIPRPVYPRGRHNAYLIDVNQNIEALVLFHNGKVVLISHVSSGGRYYYPCPGGGGTCGPAITPDGKYQALWFAKGWLTVPLGTMYNPVFFIGGSYAIHGDIPVPLQAVSHGCVRIPMDVANFFHRLIPISERAGRGAEIYIWGRT